MNSFEILINLKTKQFMNSFEIFINLKTKQFIPAFGPDLRRTSSTIFGTNIKAIERKQQKMIARAMNAK